MQRQFETAINWGRYAEIFDYDRESGRLVQTEAAQAAAASADPAIDNQPSPPTPKS